MNMERVSVSENAVHQDALYVNWHLLDGCNHDCEYNHEPESALNERFSREALLTAAYRLLSLNRPEYIFHLYGGEPTIHPYFPELLKYLATSGRNVRMVLDTNGLRAIDYYRQLLKGVPRGRLCVHIDVHCKYMELQPLLVLIAHVAEGGQFCRVTINHVPEYADKARMFSEKLLKLRQALPFEMDVAFPLGGSADWLRAVQQGFAGMTQPLLEMPAWALPAQEHSPLEFLDKDFMCVGVNGVQVAPDGTFTLGLRESDQPFVPQVMEYAPLRPGFPQAPTFAVAADAEAWLAEFCIRTLRYELDGGPVRSPLHLDMEEEQRLRTRLKRLPSASSYRRKRTPQPELWQKRQADVLKALSCLKDEESRAVFLRRLKSHLLGDSAYLVRSAYAQFKHPCLEEYGELSPDDPACRLIRLSDGVTPENIAALLPRIQWYQPVLELVLPQTQQWIDVILALHAALPDYQSYLGQHGMQSVLYGLPSAPRKRHLPVPPRTVDGQPLVSIIVAASGGSDDVARSLESSLAQQLSRYEVIVVQDADATASSDVVDDFVRRAPWHVRPYRFDSALTLSAAYDAGLDMAQGEYVCFLRSGDMLKERALPAVIDVLEREQADVAVALPSVVQTTCIEGPAVLTRFLIGQLGQCGTGDKVYRSSVIHTHAVVFGNLPGKMEDDLFNVPVFHCARKVVIYAGTMSTRTEGHEASPEQVFKTFLVNLDSLARFCAAHNLHMDSPEVRAYVLRRFQEVKPDFLRFVREAQTTGRLDEVLDEDTLRVLTLTPAIVELICEEFAPAYCRANNISVEILPEPAPAMYDHYHGASDAFDIPYPLSIIVTVEDKASLVCLERLAQEDSALVECVVIDNAVSEEMSAVLEDYADMYLNFRLFRMKKKALAPQCRNAGLEQARGESVTFMESDDEPMLDFVVIAVDAMQDKKLDAAIFGVQRVNTDGVTDYPFMNADVGTGAEAVAFFLEKGMKLDPIGIVFSRERLIRASIWYAPEAIEWEADFVVRALHDAVVTPRTDMAYLHEEKNPINSVAVHPHSLEDVCAFYASVEELKETGDWNNAALDGLNERLVQSLKQAWLPTCVAHMQGNNGLTMKDSALLQTVSILRTLMGEYSQFAVSE